MNQLVILFIGLASFFSGAFILIYQLVINRKQNKNSVIDVNESLEFERNINPNQDLRRPISTPPIVTSPYQALHQTAPAGPPTLPNMALTGTVTVAGASSIPAAAPASVDTIIGSLEALIQARLSGAIDEQTYAIRKAQLLSSYNAQSTGSSVSAAKIAALQSSAPGHYSSMEELVIDYAEGLIDQTQYEMHKARLQA